jgi:hypothetical protein
MVKHGGKRVGAGRKKDPSKVMRIPLPMVSLIKRLIMTYKKNKNKS